MEIKLPRKRFSDSSVSSLIHSWLMPGKAFGHQKLAQIFMKTQLSDGDWSPLVVELTLVKCHQRLVAYPGVDNIQPQLGVEES